MPYCHSKTSSKKSQARFKALKATRKSQVHQLRDGVLVSSGYLSLEWTPL
ncbi:hypothetical protein RhiirC2_803853 [Rhizophagus irregularis]|uniref:Uncharacterized protein n=1 Tax=Rhizophagus irregularis TaxID=588596 RepID=A0A2N1L9E6_9GLOM|nr:hypothetical protein RhiirC2_803853 [Rhizophagus irregularis]